MYRSDHFALQVQDIDRAIDFYTQKLGLTVLMPKEYNEEEQAEFAFLQLEGGNLELVKLHSQPDYEKASDDNNLCPHLALATDSLDQTIAMLEGYNIPIFQGPFESENVSRWLYVRDTEGNVLEFIQWLNR